MDERKKACMKALKRELFRGNGGYFALALIQTFLLTAANLFLSWLMQPIIDLAAGMDTGFSLERLALLSGAFILLVALVFVLAYCSIPYFVSRAAAQYKSYIFSRLIEKNISAFSSENSSMYISALSNDASSVESGYVGNILAIVTQAALFVGALALMLYYSPLLTLFSAVLSLLPLLGALLAGNRVARAEEESAEKNRAYMAVLQESIAGFSVIKAFRAEKDIRKVFEAAIDQSKNAKCRRQKASIVVQALSSLGGEISQMGVFLLGAWLALNGRGVSPGVVIVFVQLMNYLILPFSNIPQHLAEMKAGRALMERAAESLSLSLREDGEEELESLSHGLRLEELSFSYGDEPVIKGLSYSFEKGKSYALVGPSGCGKSTLLNLMLGAWENYTGGIYYDETELRELSSSSIHRLSSLVQQNVFIFNASIKDNICMFRDFPQEELQRAIELSGLGQLCRDKGLGYICGENGSALSGGEKQRISIARSLLSRAELLLVDEATAALDGKTAFQVAESILKLEGLTRIVVTHALDERLLRRYDAILVLKAGEITEMGSFQELMDKKAYFYSMYTLNEDK